MPRTIKEILTIPIFQKLYTESQQKIKQTTTARITPKPNIMGRMVTRPIRDPCSSRARRKAVLLSLGKVQRSGGAPGPYKRNEHSKEKC